MAWLGTWAKRRKITIDNTNIDSDLTHFPVPIVLGTSVGQSSQDVSDIFDEIGSSSKKIAITKADGDTQIYGEIEHWEDTNEKAVIWVSKSDLVLSNSGTTDLYIYYDSAQSDNTTYIGDTGETPAQSVWDANFKGVWHMAQDPSGGTGAILDSTSNENHGTSSGAMLTGDLVDGEIGKAIDFDGTDDFIQVPNSSDFDFTSGGYTFEVKWHPGFDLNGTSGIDKALITKGGSTATAYVLKLDETADKVQFATFNPVGSLADNVFGNNTIWAASTHYYSSVAFTGSAYNFYLDSSADGTPAGSDSPGAGTADLYFADNGIQDQPFLGRIEDMRLSSTERSAAWLKATSYALEDDLLTFTVTETAVQMPTAEMTMAASLILKISPTIPPAEMTMAADMDNPIALTAPVIPPAEMAMVARVGIKETVEVPTAEMTMAASVTGVSIQIAVPAAKMTMTAGLGDVLIFDHTRADVYYIFTLTGAADSLADIEMAMTSFQTRMRNGDPTFLSVVIPDSTQASAITARPNGTLKIDMAYKLQGAFIQRETIVQVDLESVRIDEGATSSPVTLSGHKTETYPGAIVTLATSTYGNIIDGKITHRLAEPNISLRPGDTVTIGSDTFVVDLITYFISVKSKTMEISGE